MTRRIEYIEGQILGPYGIKYIKDVDPYVQANGKTIRQGLFECPHCKKHNTFIARISNVKNGHTKSCGCLADKARRETIKKYNETHPEP